MIVVDEMDLVGSECLTGPGTLQRLFSGAAVQAYQFARLNGMNNLLGS